MSCFHGPVNTLGQTLGLPGDQQHRPAVAQDSALCVVWVLVGVGVGVYVCRYV